MSARILVIEDDPVSRGIVSRFLESWGYHVDVAEEAMAAIELLRRERFALVLLDYHLPDIDGYMAARLIRNMSDRETGPKIGAITSDCRGLAARVGETALLDGILAKPVVPQALDDFVANLLDPPAPCDANRAAAAFVRHPHHESGQTAAAAFWCARGLTGRPRAAVLPAPTPDQQAATSLCFDLCQPAEAEVILVLDAEGIERLAHLRGQDGILAPALDIGSNANHCCEAIFKVDDPASWTRVADIITGHASRRARLNTPQALESGDTRLLKYLFLAQSTLRIGRSASLPPMIIGAGGFPRDEAAAGAERLSERGLLTRKTQVCDVGESAGVLLEHYELTARAIEFLTQPDQASLAATQSPTGGAGEGAALLAHDLHVAQTPGSGLSPSAGQEDLPFRILVAIEQPINREITSSMLTAVNYAVDSVADAVGALAAVETQVYDLVVVDAQMRDADGTPAHVVIRGRGDAPVLVVGASLEPDDVERLRIAGVEAVLRRPFRSADLYTEVEGLVRRRRAKAADQALVGFDRETYDGLLHFMNARSRRFLLDALLTQIATVPHDDGESAEGRAVFAAAAHTMISAAGMLGFSGFSAASRAVCDALRSGRAVELSRFRPVCEATQSFIVALLGGDVESAAA